MEVIRLVDTMNAIRIFRITYLSVSLLVPTFFVVTKILYLLSQINLFLDYYVHFINLKVLQY